MLKLMQSQYSEVQHCPLGLMPISLQSHQVQMSPSYAACSTVLHKEGSEDFGIFSLLRNKIKMLKSEWCCGNLIIGLHKSFISKEW